MKSSRRISTVQRAIICGVAARLKKLEVDGLVKRRAYNKRPLRCEYHLTNKGEAFFPVLLALRAWGET